MATKKLLIMTVALTFFSLSAVGCNAVKGLGKDLQESAENVEEALDREFNGNSDW